jgi:hypothetical protein
VVAAAVAVARPAAPGRAARGAGPGRKAEALRARAGAPGKRAARAAKPARRSPSAGKEQGKGKGKGQGKDGGKDGPEKLGKNKKGGKNGGSGLASAKDSKAKQSPLSDLYREAWGHLEKTRRQEMDAYAREQYMERYRELLQEYYNAVGKLRRQMDE